MKFKSFYKRMNRFNLRMLWSAVSLFLLQILIMIIDIAFEIEDDIILFSIVGIGFGVSAVFFFMGLWEFYMLNKTYKKEWTKRETK